MKRHSLRQLVNTLLALGVMLASVPFFVFGYLGLWGRLTDTSEGENSVQGLAFTGVAIALFVLGAFSLIVVRKCGTRSHAGFCAVCGYDLRATPDRCPECCHVARASSP